MPVWRNLTRKDVANYSPLLADRLAVIVGDNLERVVTELLRAIQRDVSSVVTAARNPARVFNSSSPSIPIPPTSSLSHLSLDAIQPNSEAVLNVDALASESFKRALSGEKRVIETEWRKPASVARLHLKLFYNSLTRHFNALADRFTLQYDTLATRLRVALPRNAVVEKITQQAFSTNCSPCAFLAISSAPRLSPDFLQDDTRNSLVVDADSQLEKSIEQIRTMDFVTPVYNRGSTTVMENSTYPNQDRNRPERNMIRNNTSEVTENSDFQILKGIFGGEFGNFEVIHLEKVKSRARKHQVVNPYACYWSGEIDYDEVIYEHFYRWRLRIKVMPERQTDERVSAFHIELLDSKADFSI